MDKAAFELLKKLEGTWWHQGRMAAVAQALRATRCERPFRSALDYGAGYGGMQAFLARYAAEVDCFEPDDGSREVAHTRGYARVYRALDDLAQMRAHYDLIGAFDVIEHLEDDAGALRMMHGLLRSGGVLAVTVPAFQWLWSKHDEEHHHYRRYAIGALTALVKNSGFDVAYARYWNVALFPAVASLRLLGVSGGKALDTPPPVQRALKAILRLEAKMVSKVYVPFGLSIVLVAVKK